MTPAELIAPVVARSRLIAVVTVEAADEGPPLARALCAGGVASVEITLRTPAALEAIRRAAAEVPQALVGAGTCLTVEDLKAAKAAGAAFAVSPGLDPALLEAAHALQLPYVPGVASASEVMRALRAGYTTCKPFPAEPLGGVALLKALGGPFPQVRFCPTGGIGPDAMADYLALPNVACVGGSWLAPPALIARGDWPGVERLARAATAA